MAKKGRKIEYLKGEGSFFVKIIGIIISTYKHILPEI